MYNCRVHRRDCRRRAWYLSVAPRSTNDADVSSRDYLRWDASAHKQRGRLANLARARKRGCPTADAFDGDDRRGCSGPRWVSCLSAGILGVVGIAPITMILVALLAIGGSMLLGSSFAGGLLLDLLRR